ncbi:MAG: dual specificity protein phosphatase family protein, partial [Verrucomicrobiota bacterium]
RTGIVYVHCKVGYSRSAMAVGAYLLHQGHAAHLRAVLDQLRTVRKPIIIRPEAIASLQAWAERQPRPTPAATAWATAS